MPHELLCPVVPAAVAVRAGQLLAFTIVVFVAIPYTSGAPARRPSGPVKTATTLGAKRPKSPRRRATSGSAATTSLSLKRAVALALRRNPTLKLSALKKREALLKVKAARGALLPKIQLKGNAFVWDSALKFDIAIPELGPPPADCPIGCLSYMGGLFSAFDLGNIRDQFTLQLSVTVAQPVTALFALLKRLKIQKLGVTAANLDRRLQALKLRFSVRKTYLQVLQVERYVIIAADAVKLIQAIQRQVTALYKAEVVGKTEVLKIKVALAAARQRLAQARSGAALARAALRMHIGAKSTTRFRLTEQFKDPPPGFTKSLSGCQKTALRLRPELKILSTQHQMLRAGRKAARIMLLPQAVVMATYQFSHGMGSFQPTHAFFAGVSLSWTFEWGSQYRETQALDAKSLQLLQVVRQVRRGVRLEVRKHHLGVRTAYLNLGVARTAVREAAEGLRLERLRFGQGVKIATDLLDAQARHNRARLQYSSALFSYYIGLAALDGAMGLKK